MKILAKKDGSQEWSKNEKLTFICDLEANFFLLNV